MNDYCPRCLREMRPDLTGVIRKGEQLTPTPTIHQETRRTAPIGFTPEPAKPSRYPTKKAKDTLTQPTESEGLTSGVNVKFTASMRERIENLARLRVSSIPDLVREAVGDFLEANDA